MPYSKIPIGVKGHHIISSN